MGNMTIWTQWWVFNEKIYTWYRTCAFHKCYHKDERQVKKLKMNRISDFFYYRWFFHIFWINTIGFKGLHTIYELWAENEGHNNKITTLYLYWLLHFTTNRMVAAVINSGWRSHILLMWASEYIIFWWFHK